ncbi:hypothetical protein GCM10007388_38910 [Pseudoduganella plicata]|uniref:Uncharacterized protein n=1 Tax=Pseudoduganella plicata TaxID=321984 RepID=A0AA87YFF2_9BURK|nr:hypothetical protein GCM10007388_38910 [Pseudoduganella plicata]
MARPSSVPIERLPTSRGGTSSGRAGRPGTVPATSGKDAVGSTGKEPAALASAMAVTAAALTAGAVSIRQYSARARSSEGRGMAAAATGQKRAV